MYAYLRSHIFVGLGLCVSKNDLKMWIWEVFTRWEWEPYDQNVFLRGEVEDSSQRLRKIMCAVSWPQDESFSTSSFLLARLTRFWGTCKNNQKKTCQKSSLVEENRQIENNRSQLNHPGVLSHVWGEHRRVPGNSRQFPFYQKENQLFVNQGSFSMKFFI